MLNVFLAHNCLNDHLFETLNYSEAQKKSVVAVLSAFKHRFAERWQKGKTATEQPIVSTFKAVTNTEVWYIESQIATLVNTVLNWLAAGLRSSIHYISMSDGKVCNVATETTSTLRFQLCKATSKDFNNPKEVYERDVDETTFMFGLFSMFGSAFLSVYSTWHTNCQYRNGRVEASMTNV